MRDTNINRLTVKRVSCPECKAQAGFYCLGSRGQPRTSCHQPRWQAYREIVNAKVNAPVQ